MVALIREYRDWTGRVRIGEHAAARPRKVPSHNCVVRYALYSLIALCQCRGGRNNAIHVTALLKGARDGCRYPAEPGEGPAFELGKLPFLPTPSPCRLGHESLVLGYQNG